MQQETVLVDRLVRALPYPASRVCGGDVRKAWTAKPWVQWAEEMSDTRESEAYHLGRIRYFLDMLESGILLPAIEIDNECSGCDIHPIPILLDGHHRLVAAELYGSKRIGVEYGGRMDLLMWLSGESEVNPADEL